LYSYRTSLCRLHCTHIEPACAGCFVLIVGPLLPDALLPLYEPEPSGSRCECFRSADLNGLHSHSAVVTQPAATDQTRLPNSIISEMSSPRSEMSSPRSEIQSPRSKMQSPRSEMASPRSQTAAASNALLRGPSAPMCRLNTCAAQLSAHCGPALDWTADQCTATLLPLAKGAACAGGAITVFILIVP
jgi:hypothetical protein